MTEPTIICPSCKTEIKLTESRQIGGIRCAPDIVEKTRGHRIDLPGVPLKPSVCRNGVETYLIFRAFWDRL